MKAIWNGKTIAQSDDIIEVEGNAYFPKKDVNMNVLKPSDTTSQCPWKGKANYYDVVVDGKTNKDAAWYYPEPSSLAENIRDHIAFWNGVEVSE